MSTQKNKFEERPYVVPRKKWWLPPLIGVVILGILGLVVHKLYVRYEPDRLTKKAQALIEQKDYRGAALLLNQAVHIDGGSQFATRTMADLMEKARSPQAVDWRRRVLDLNPTGMQDALSLARLALREGKVAIAEQGLERIPAESRANADWQSASGMAAIRGGKWKKARDHFQEAVRLEPNNDVHLYNLALAQLQSADETERKAGEANLITLTSKGKVNLFAQRTLVERFAQQGKIEDALAQSTGIVDSKNAQISDLLTHVDLLRRLKRPEAAAALEKAHEMASQKASDAAPMITWHRLHGEAAEGLAWADQLDPKLAEDSGVIAARAECLYASARWKELQTVAAGTDWGAANVRRLALLSRAQFELHDRHGSEASWAQAIQLAAGDRGQLGRLAASASEWGWKLQMLDTLWAATTGPSPEWALRTLNEGYSKDGNTAGILRVARRQLEITPNDTKARNNAIQCALLVGEDPSKALVDARRLAADVPSDPVVVSTFSYALLMNGMLEESLAAIEKLPMEVRRKPEIALYYALALNATGDYARAKEIAPLAKTAKLLPEESAMLRKFADS